MNGLNLRGTYAEEKKSKKKIGQQDYSVSSVVFFVHVAALKRSWSSSIIRRFYDTHVCLVLRLVI